MSSETETINALRADNEALRRRQAELEGELRRRDRVIQTLIDNVPGIVYVTDAAWTLRHVNRQAAAMMGLAIEAIVGRPDADFFPKEVVERWHENDRRMMASGEPRAVVEEHAPHADGVHIHESTKFPIRDDTGEIFALGGISVDITQARRAEERLRESEARIIDAQRDAMRELGTPIIPLTSDTVVVPVVGSMDPVRAQQLMEALLREVAARGSGTVIVDITGATALDAQAAEALVRAARAVKLLGARVILTGISPATAHTLVTLNVHLDEILALGSLQDGITYALKRRDR
jgi:rsbT co-antagonist protein RsbR